MLKLLIALILLFSGCSVIESDTNNTEATIPPLNEVPILGNPNQVEIVTWNIEHFPKNGDSTLEYLATIIDKLDVDIYVLQEIVSIPDIQTLVDAIPDYHYIKTEHNNQLNLVFLYNTKTISVSHSKELWYGSTNLQYFAHRPPLRMDFTWNNGTIEESLTIINLHLKCCGNGVIDLGNSNDEEFRRLTACQLLHDYVLDSLQNSNVIIAGDWNDALQEPVEQNVFWPLISDSTKFTFVDIDIANGDETEWSWQGWNSSYSAAHFDHIMINEYLFDEMQSEQSIVQTIHVEDFFENGAADYDNYISDHRPVLWQFSPLQ